LVAALARNVPHAIYADVDSEDLDGRANHLEEVFASAIERTTWDVARRVGNDRGDIALGRKCASMRIGGPHDPPV
jgi:hypothetical protein